MDTLKKGELDKLSGIRVKVTKKNVFGLRVNTLNVGS
jgi:hypothetical protein